MAAGWSSSQPLDLAVAHEDFGVGGGGGELLGPDVGFAGAPVAGDGDGGVERVELFDAAAEEVGEWAGLALGLEARCLRPSCRSAGPRTRWPPLLDVGDEVLGGFGSVRTLRRGGDDEFVVVERRRVGWMTSTEWRGRRGGGV